MHEAFKTLSNVQESPVVFEAAADCVIALLVRLEDHDNSPFMSALELNIFNAVRRLEVNIAISKMSRNVRRGC